jgi:hypothetical protein
MLVYNRAIVHDMSRIRFPLPRVERRLLVLMSVVRSARCLWLYTMCTLRCADSRSILCAHPA